MIYIVSLGNANHAFMRKVIAPKTNNAVILVGTCYGASGVRCMVIMFAGVTAVFSWNHAITKHNRAAMVIIATPNPTDVIPSMVVSFRLHKVSELSSSYLL